AEKAAAPASRERIGAGRIDIGEPEVAGEHRMGDPEIDCDLGDERVLAHPFDRAASGNAGLEDLRVVERRPYRQPVRSNKIASAEIHIASRPSTRHALRHFRTNGATKSADPDA